MDTRTGPTPARQDSPDHYVDGQIAALTTTFAGFVHYVAEANGDILPLDFAALLEELATHPLPAARTDDFRAGFSEQIRLMVKQLRDSD